jgi:hypothetical protein
LRQLHFRRILNKNAEKYTKIKAPEIFTKTLAHPKTLAGTKTLAPSKSLADGKNLAHPKSLADAKNLEHPKSLAPTECWCTGKN